MKIKDELAGTETQDRIAKIETKGIKDLHIDDLHIQPYTNMTFAYKTCKDTKYTYKTNEYMIYTYKIYAYMTLTCKTSIYMNYTYKTYTYNNHTNIHSHT